MPKEIIDKLLKLEKQLYFSEIDKNFPESLKTIQAIAYYSNELVKHAPVDCSDSVHLRQAIDAYKVSRTGSDLRQVASRGISYASLKYLEAGV
jgi:hypothetical protein